MGGWDKAEFHGVTYMGIAVFEKLHRRLDIKAYPRDELPFAMLYFTGSDHFNRSMRWHAKKSGYTMSDHGLYPVIRLEDHTRAAPGQTGKIVRGKAVPCSTEEDVFDALGLEYRLPEERNCLPT